ncbi:MAG: protein kinase [Holophagae bacterium]|jgi:tRNA A-37 threonylcarbamoyl transferase component Bud32
MSEKKVGRYEIEKAIGRGAMGVVYLARDPIIDRRVALKTLRVDLDAEFADEFRERFVREARAAGRLNHPGIVTVHDVGEDPDSGLMYIAMEHVEGRDLKQIVTDGQVFHPSEAARIAADVAAALDYAHSLGVVHRDVKPANIILTSDGTAKITDFGIAHLETSNLTVEGQFIGTPNFMSPEQITGNAVDGRSDIFSLGVVLFTLLTGQRPFGGDTMHEVTLRIVQEPSPIPSTLVEDIPAAFNPIVLKCLEKSPERRFQTGAELAKVLGALARTLVALDAEDTGGARIDQTDFSTNVHGAPLAAKETITSRMRELWLGLRERIELPEWAGWEVEGRWAWGIIGAAVLLLAVSVVGLRMSIDKGPFLAPSIASTRNLNSAVQSMQTAEAQLAKGNLAAAKSSIQAALDQVPSSPSARQVAHEISDAIESERTSADNQRRVAELVNEGRQLYRTGSYGEARALFREALELDPLNEIAVSYLELSEERLKRSRTRSTTSRTARAAGNPQAVAAPSPTPSPTSGIARVTLSFDSPISTGLVAITLDGESLAEVPFDFSTKGILGIKRKGRGTVRRVILTPSGAHEIGVQLFDERQGSLGSKTFTKDFTPESRWTLRIDLPNSRSMPGFFLVQSAR